MRHTIVTMTRGDAHKIGEWLDHHQRLGFDDVQVVLDGDVDDTRAVLEARAGSSAVTVHPRAEVGEYYDGLPPAERRERVLAWRERHQEDLASGRMRGTDALAWRQHRHFAEVLAPYHQGSRGRGWVSLLDVDEFLVLGQHPTIGALTADQTVPRLRFISFNVDTTGYDPTRPVLAQHDRRWSYADMLAHPDQRWGRRVKSLVRNRVAQLNATVHKISRGPHVVLDPDVARLHHFKMPLGGLELPYSVHDPIELPGSGG